jgi:hypothetical protein
VPLSQNRSRLRCTVRGASCGHAGHGPHARCWRSPRPHGPRPRPTQRARPACAALAAQLGRPVQRATHSASAWRHGPAARGSAAALLGEPAAARHRRTGNGGSPARRRRRGAASTGEVPVRTAAGSARRSGRRCGRQDGRNTGTVGEAVGTQAARARRRSGRRRRAESGAAVRRALSGRVARCPDSSFKPRHRCGVLPRGPGSARGG